MKLGQSVVLYALNSQKRVTHSTIKVLHQPTSSECVTTFPCSLPTYMAYNVVKYDMHFFIFIAYLEPAQMTTKVS